MGSKTEEALVFASAHLATAAPNEWRVFLGAVTDYASDKRDECITAPVANIQVAQGFARACLALRDIFAGSLATAEKITRK